MPALIVPSDYARPAPPAPIADAVELWARRSSRHAHLLFVVEMQWWEVHLTLRPDDKRLQAYREGRVSEEPKEVVQLIAWDEDAGRYTPIRLEEYGAGGIVSLLEKGDTWSGRGEFASLQDAVEAAASRARAGRQRVKEQQRQWARDFGDDQRRQVLQIPFHRVGIDLTQPNKDHAGTSAASGRLR